MKVFAPAQILMSVLNATGWDANMTIPTGRTMTSVDTSGTVGSNLATQLGMVWAAAMSGG